MQAVNIQCTIEYIIIYFLYIMDNTHTLTVHQYLHMQANIMGKYSKTSIIQTNWEYTLVKISGSQNYRSATEDIKQTSRVFQAKKLRLHIIKYLSQNVKMEVRYQS